MARGGARRWGEAPSFAALILAGVGLSGLAPAAGALGLGELELRSRLGEPLEARIPLLEVRAGELEQLRADLAAPEDFEAVGLPRPPEFAGIRFEVQGARTAAPYIEATSRERIREPILEFIIEVQWSSGRLMREYSVLLPPP
jgi:pilus assembly protein FimV